FKSDHEWGPRRHVFEADVFQRVINAANQVERKRFGQTESRAGLFEIVQVAVVIEFAVVQVDSKCQFPVQKPWFNKRNLKILSFQTERGTHSEFLAATAEVGWIEKIEIAFAITDKPE